MGRPGVVAAGVFACLLAGPGVAGCSGGDSGSAGTDITVPSLPAVDCAATTPTLRVDLIDDAIAAVETELGGVQQFFEINATEQLVNLWVASSDGASATPWVYVGGELSSGPAEAGASGNRFGASSLDFDPQKVTSCLAAELPTSVPTVFEIVGGPDGAVRYTVATASPAGGQLVVVVDADGAVLSVDPV